MVWGWKGRLVRWWARVGGGKVARARPECDGLPLFFFCWQQKKRESALFSLPLRTLSATFSSPPFWVLSFLQHHTLLHHALDLQHPPSLVREKESPFIAFHVYQSHERGCLLHCSDWRLHTAADDSQTTKCFWWRKRCPRMRRQKNDIASGRRGAHHFFFSWEEDGGEGGGGGGGGELR